MMGNNFQDPAKPKEKKPLRIFFIVILVLLALGFVNSLLNRLHPAQGVKDTIAWTQLEQAEVKGWKKMEITFPDALNALDGKEVVITGYMFPLESGEKQSQFLLSAYRPTCPFCLPGGPKQLIHVAETAGRIPYATGQTTLKGQLHLSKTDEERQEATIYKMTKVRKIED